MINKEVPDPTEHPCCILHVGGVLFEYVIYILLF